MDIDFWRVFWIIIFHLRIRRVRGREERIGERERGEDWLERERRGLVRGREERIG